MKTPLNTLKHEEFFFIPRSFSARYGSFYWLNVILEKEKKSKFQIIDMSLTVRLYIGRCHF